MNDTREDDGLDEAEGNSEENGPIQKEHIKIPRFKRPRGRPKKGFSVKPAKTVMKGRKRRIIANRATKVDLEKADEEPVKRPSVIEEEDFANFLFELRFTDFENLPEMPITVAFEKILTEQGNRVDVHVNGLPVKQRVRLLNNDTVSVQVMRDTDAENHMIKKVDNDGVDILAESVKVLVEDEDYMPNKTPRKTPKLLEAYGTSSTRFKCPHCPKLFKTQAAFFSHIRLHKVQVLKCGACNFTCQNRAQLRYHNKRAHQTTRYPCLSCGMKFFTNDELIEHQSSHANSETEPCPFCSRTFKHVDYLKRHMNFGCVKNPNRKKYIPRRTHSGLKCDTVCDQCGKTVPMDKLKEHVRRMHKSKPERIERIECEVCRKVLSSKKSYRAHMQRHEGIKVHVCEYCGKGFRTALLLEEHRAEIHSNASPTPCTKCDKVFYTAQGMAYHQRTHEVQYNCEYCTESFNSEHDYVQHVNIRHINSRFNCVCLLCRQSLPSVDELRKHSDDSHSTESRRFIDLTNSARSMLILAAGGLEESLAINMAERLIKSSESVKASQSHDQQDRPLLFEAAGNGGGDNQRSIIQVVDPSGLVASSGDYQTLQPFILQLPTSHLPKN